MGACRLTTGATPWAWRGTANDKAARRQEKAPRVGAHGAAVLVRSNWGLELPTLAS
jgi:hypothetical protein